MTAGYFGEACRDFLEGSKRGWLWFSLGRNDIRQRYSGSLLGSLWITASISLLVLFLTLIFAGPFGVEVHTYVPYVAIGLVFWHFIQATLVEAPFMFITAVDTVHHSNLPLSIQALRLICRNAVVLAHNAVIIPIVMILFGIPLSMSVVPALAGLLLLAGTLLAGGLLLGVIGARFRDVSQIVIHVMQLLFLVTPIFWLPTTLDPDRSWIVGANPVHAFIDIVRAPLLGVEPAPTSWPVALLAAFFVVAASVATFARFRRRISYWL